MPATLLETVIVTPTRTEQRLGDVPASVNILTREEIEASPARRGRRRPAPGSDVQPVPPHQQPRRPSDDAGRVAARDRAERAEPHARPARRRSVQRSVRRLGVLDSRAARSASIASRSPTTRRRACTATTRWAASSTSSRAGRRGERSRSSRSTATSAARSSTSSPATDGTRWARPSKAASSTRTAFPSSRRASAGRSTTTPTSTTGTSARKLDYTPTDRVNAFFRAGVLHRGSDQREGRRGQRHQVDDRERRRPGPVAGRERPPGARVRRRGTVALQLPGGDQRGHDAEHRPPGDRSARADQRRRRHGAVVQGARRHRIVLQRRRATGAGSTATARKMRTSPAVPDGHRSAGDASASTLIGPARVSGGTQQSPGAFVQDIFTPVLEAGGHAQRARRSLAELRRPQPGDHGGDRPADRQQPAVAFPNGATRSSARASRRSTT